MNLIKEYSLKQLTNAMHFNFIESFLAKLAQFTALVAKVNANYLVLKNKAADEDEVLQLSQKSLTTDEIVEADNRRDSLFRSYRKRVEASLDSPLEAEAEAAKVVNQSLKDYNIDPKMKIDEETGRMTNLLTDHEGKLAEQVATLGLTQYVTAMKEANELVKTLLAERADERAKQVVGAMKAARAATDTAYKSLVQRINAVMVLQAEDEFDDFVAYVNEEIKRYRTEMRAGRKSKKTDTTTTEK